MFGQVKTFQIFIFNAADTCYLGTLTSASAITWLQTESQLYFYLALFISNQSRLATLKKKKKKKKTKKRCHCKSLSLSFSVALAMSTSVRTCLPTTLKFCSHRWVETFSVSRCGCNEILMTFWPSCGSFTCFLRFPGRANKQHDNWAPLISPCCCRRRCIETETQSSDNAKWLATTKNVQLVWALLLTYLNLRAGKSKPTICIRISLLCCQRKSCLI